MMPLKRYESLSKRVNRLLWLVDLLGAVLTAPTRLWRRCFGVRQQPIRKILLTRCDGIGDLVCSIPAIHAIRKRFGDAELVLMVGPWSRDVAELIPGPDRLLVHAPWGYRRLRAVRSDRSLSTDWDALRKIRRERFDIAIDLRGDLLTLLPMLFWGIPRRVGRATRGGGFALTQTVPPVGFGRQHEVDRTLDVAAAVGAAIDDRTATLDVSGALQKAAKQIYQDNKLNPARTIILAPGAQWRWKQWPHFAELVKQLLDEKKQVAIVGAAGDASLAREIIEAVPGVVDLTGQTDLQQLTALFSLCQGFVAVDSGPAHLAAASGAAGVALFGSSEPERFAPISDKVRVLHRTCPFFPCYQRGDCRIPEQWCMERIEADAVYQALVDVLS